MQIIVQYGLLQNNGDNSLCSAVYHCCSLTSIIFKAANPGEKSCPRKRGRTREFGINMHTAAAAAKWLQSCLTLCDPTDGSPPTRLRRPWDSPGKSTGVSTRLSFDWVLLPSLPLLPGHLPFRVLCARLTHCLPVATVLLCPHLQTAQSPPRSTAPSPASPDFSTGQNGGIKTKSLFHAPNSQ